MENKNKKTIKTLSIILISIIIFIIVLFCLIYFVILSPKNNYNKFFNNVFETSSKIVNKLSIDESATSINKGNIKINTNLDKYINISNYEIEYDIEHDRKNSKTLIDLKLGDEEETLNSMYYYEPNNLYIEFPYIMATMIKIPLDDYGYKYDDNKLFNYNKDSSDYIMSIIKNSFINNMNSNKMKNSISSYHIKSTYIIDKEELTSLLDSIINDLKNDNKALQILNDEFKIDDGKLNKYKTDILDYFNDNHEYIEISLFVNILFKTDKITIKTKAYDITLDIDEDYDLLIKENGKEIVKSTFNNKMINLNINRTSRDVVVELMIDTSKDELNLDGFVNFVKDSDDFIKLDLSLSFLLNEEISDFDTTQAKSFNQFTKKDLKSVNKVIKQLNKYIELLLGNDEYLINLSN